MTKRKSESKLYIAQIEFEERYAKNVLLKRIKQEFTNMGAASQLEAEGIPVAFGLDLMVQIYLHKRASVGTLVGILFHHFKEDYPENPYQACANALSHCVSTGVLDWDTKSESFVVKFSLPNEIQKELDQYQFPLPVLVPPKKVKSNRDVGYFTFNGSILLKNNHHDDDVVLEHINKLNSISLCMNPDTVQNMQNKWRNLDKPKEDESMTDYYKRKKAFEKFDTASRDVLKSLFILGNEFYLTHKYDKRGRTYCVGYHVNYQGTDWSKSVVEFTNKEVVK